MHRSLAVLMLFGLAAGDFAPGRKLLDEGSDGGDDAGRVNTKPLNVPVLDGLPYVYDGQTAEVFEELVPFVESMQTYEPLMAAVQVCADTIGIPYVASFYAHVFFDAASAFKAYGFCALTNMEEHANRMSYMVEYAQSNLLKAVLLQDYTCDGLTSMPEQCWLSPLVEAALNETVALYDGEDGFCAPDTDDAIRAQQVPVEVLTLPLDYTPEYPALWTCVARPPMVAQVAAASTDEAAPPPPPQ